ncbi:MAG: ASKHA domain-containing protein, partial [Pseudomonadota bacterium]
RRGGGPLSCSATVQGDVVIDIPAGSAVAAQVIRKAGDTRIIERNPAVTLCYVEVEEPDMDKPLGDVDRLLVALEQEWGIENAEVDFRLYATAQTILRKGEWAVTAAIHRDHESDRPKLIGLWPGLKNEAYGIAVDIGSTTIAMHLVSLLSGNIIASSGTPNPQIRFGEDLMSRVSYGMMNPDGPTKMTEAVRASLGDMIREVSAQADIEPTDIIDAVFVGNPVMHHLFLGIDPVELGGAPFALAVSGAVSVRANGLGLPIHTGARAYVLPCIAGHVGADAAAATLAEAPERENDITLLVDVGTNAEIVLGNKDRLLACSSPTGPAFEGAEISAGQRAAPGAIERLRIDPATLEPRFRVIGVEQWSDEEGFTEAAEQYGVTGLCGSGIIEVIAEMFLAGIITTDGVIDGSLAAKSPRIVPDGRTFSYVVREAAEGQPAITVTQNDVRAIQLAKAALYAGVRLLMDRLGEGTIDQVRLAGAFGSFIEPKYALVLGLVPDCAVDKVRAVGNAAGTGARMALLNRDHRRAIERTVRNIEKIETATEAKFQEHFVNAMALPNKVEAFPKLAEIVTLPVPTSPAPMEGAPRARRGGRRRSA